MNDGLGQIDVWNEEVIQQRAERLAVLAAAVWDAPHLSAEVLADYKPKTERLAPSYSISDHLHLAEGTPSRRLFDALRKEVLVLDPGVAEEFLKLYVAYKAETNFVDVIPLAKRLQLVLNMPFHELHDPRGLARDVTNLGLWGNGDVEVAFESLADLPYILGLIRQSFERQIGNGGPAE